MSISKIRLNWLAVVLLGGSSALWADVSPFIVPPEDLFSRVQRIALMPTGIAIPVENSGAVASQYEALVTARLQAAGFAVIPSSAYHAIHAELAERMGGELDDAQRQAVKAHAKRELLVRHAGDALLYPLISLVGVDSPGHSATWHGIEEPTGSFAAGMRAPAGARTLPALSFIAVLTGIGGDSWYAGAGGVQLLARMEDDRLVKVPARDLLTDERRNERAVELALAGFGDMPD
ncbi:hypothetical protein BH24PSE2_BH24PSE2_22530 [soil metagenome]